MSPDEVEALLAEGVGDGLPVVEPTEERLAAMGGDDVELGPVPPLFGALTSRKVAYYAVLAGCRPAELPVVVAGLRACLEPEFNLLGVQTTTGTAAVCIVVGGPVVERLGFHPGANVLGPGNRVNACVGRAVALALAGIGGARPGETDMATTGQPGRYTFCLPEHRTPFGGVAGRGGTGRDGSGLDGSGFDGSAVSVLAVGGTAEVLPRGGGGTVAEILDPLAHALAGAVRAAGDPTRMASGAQAVVLPPEVAGRLAGLGETAGSIARALYEGGTARAGHPVAASPADVHVIVSGGPGIKMLHLPGWIGGSRAVHRVLDRRS
ncbi:hypothetical protein LWC33_08740 [Pseudonocardia sp. RS11V-5]|uniref:hypothetical protein n=1 Tax=Pseudonocardia terrae TaxID=2905831 RepID=UPI001E65D868|nr:hypothetical protein [Pseudonocardia terrae]MCE3551539.1 hypothetical protein [Pseudonocardia terrae]